MKKRYFHALLLLLLAMMLPSKMWAAKTIYTVYCIDGDDKIIYFVYKDADTETIPVVGNTWDGKTITAVYTNSATGWRNDNTNKPKANVTKVVFDDSFADARPTTTQNWFWECSKLKTIEDISNLNTSSVTNMGSMFASCKALTSLDLSSFNTANVTNMSYLFQNCSSLTSIHVDILNWTTAKVTSSKSTYMFSGCSSLPNYSNVSDYTITSCPTLLTYHFDDYYNGEDISSKLEQLKTKLESGELSTQSIAALQLDRTIPTENYATICLPVALTAAQVTSTFGSGTVVKKLTGATFDSSTNTLSFTFTNVSSIEAGKPYLIKSANDKPAIIANATITATENGSITIEGVCTMYGLLKSQAMTEDRSILFMSGGELYYPTGGTLKAMRCYFQLLGDAADAANDSGASSARPRAVINFDNAPSETGILSIEADGSLTYEETGDWYTLGGVKLSGKPTTKGMYILNGKKYIVK